MRVVSTRVVYENRWMRVHEDRTEREDGTPGLYGWIEKPLSAMIVAIEDGHVWLVEQFRHPVRAALLGVPAGRLEDAAAARGARTPGARRGDRRARRAIEHLGPPVTSPTASRPGRRRVPRNRARTRRAGARITEQDLVVRRFTVEEVDRMVRENEIRDAASVAAWHLATR